MRATPHIIGALGLVLMATGLWQVHRSLMWLFAGVMVVAVAFVLRKRMGVRK